MQNQINSNNISSSAVTPQMNYTDIVSQLEQAIATDTLRLQAMLQQGVITKQQGQYLMHLALHSGYDFIPVFRNDLCIAFDAVGAVQFDLHTWHVFHPFSLLTQI